MTNNSTSLVANEQLIRVNNPFNAEVGEDIGLDEGNAMVERFQTANPQQAVTSHFVGRNILEQILSQPGVVGMNIYYALNDKGQNQLVFVGSDENGENVLEFTTVDANGMLAKNVGIVADRANTNTRIGAKK
jgi:hypothetical protein